MDNYLNTLKQVMTYGVDRSDRTGTGTRSLFGIQLRYDLQKGFPLVTTKKVHTKSIIHELLWFLKGDTNIGYLKENGVRIWNEWADSNGDLGPVYGKQWRSWETKSGETVDQIHNVINEIKTNPNSRRLIVSAWNVGELSNMALPPCHFLFQFYVADGRLSCMLNQRSCDLFLGVPFNIASYSLLTHMIAQQCNLDVGEFILNGGDAHIYHNHFEAVNEQLTRKPYDLPTLILEKKPSIDDYTYDDFQITNYQSHACIKAPIAV